MNIINKTISQRAAQWLDEGYLFIDTETTGLGDDAEIVEICIID
ncbi:3'-5' exonuclease, partial [Citrobacter sp. S55_ASV_140]|nr:3'-5' exonuclease [Citrobacter sp. S55_ASV_140]